MRLWHTLLDAFFWRLNEDDEWEHRLWREHNGEPPFTTLWSHYAGETINSELTWNTTWTHWGLGIDVEQAWEPVWIREKASYTRCRRWFVNINLGPFSLAYMRIRPRRVSEMELIESKS